MVLDDFISENRYNQALSIPFSLLNQPGPAAQSVASPTADPGIRSLMPAQCHIFAKIDHKISSRVILLPPLIQEGLMSVTRESICTKYWLTA